MRRLTVRFIVALSTFAIGVTAAMLWFVFYHSTPETSKGDDISIASPLDNQTSEQSYHAQETLAEKFYRKGGRTTEAKDVVQSDGELTTPTITESRDISLYDKAGHFDCRVYFERDFRRAEKAQSRARNFVWQHWQEKRRAYLSITYNSVDAVSTSHIFIEPDEQGTWHVAWRIVRHYGEIDDMPDIRSVERRRANKEDDMIEKSGTIIISFKDSDGDEVQKL